MKKITYKANVVYAIKPIVLFICSLLDIYLLFDIFVLGHLNGTDNFLDMTPWAIFLTFFVALGIYLFWGEPYKINKNEEAFTFFLLGKTVEFSFDKSDFLKCGHDRLGKKILYFKKKYRSYRVYESIFPEVVKTMEYIYLDEHEGSAKES